MALPPTTEEVTAIPGHIVGGRDDGANTWRVRYSRLGTDSPGQGVWGDYINCRADVPLSDRGSVAVARSKVVEARTDIVPRVVRWRVVDTMPVTSVVDNFGFNAGGWRVDRHPRFMADTTGDGRADIVGFGNAGVYVSRANADGTFGAGDECGRQLRVQRRWMACRSSSEVHGGHDR